MDVESQKTVDEAIDRLRDECVAPILAELLNIRQFLARIDGASVTLTMGSVQVRSALTCKHEWINNVTAPYCALCGTPKPQADPYQGLRLPNMTKQV